MKNLVNSIIVLVIVSNIYSNTYSRAIQYYMDGEIASMIGDFSASISSFKKSIELYPNSSTLHRSIGEVYLLKNNIPAAIQSFKFAYNLKKDVSVGLEVYDLLISDNQKDNANIILDTLIIHFPSNQELLYEKAKISMENQNWIALIDSYKQLYLLNFNIDILDRILEVAKATNKLEYAYLCLLNISKNNDSIRIIEILAQISYILGDYENCIEHLIFLKKIPEKQNSASFFLGSIFLNQKNFSDAIENFDIVYNNDDISFDLLRNMLICYSSLNNFEKENQIAKEMVERFPENTKGYEALALSYLLNSKYIESIDVLRKAINLFNNEFIFYYYLGMAFQELNNYSSSLDSFQKALSIKQDSNLIRKSIAMIYEKNGVYIKSDSLFMKIISSDSENPMDMNDYAYLISERDNISHSKLEFALDLANKALKLEPENPMVLDTVGWIHYQIGNYSKAIQFIQESINYGGDDVVILDHLGDVFIKLNNIDSAIASYRKALQKDPENDEILKKINFLINE